MKTSRKPVFAIPNVGRCFFKFKPKKKEETKIDKLKTQLEKNFDTDFEFILKFQLDSEENYVKIKNAVVNHHLSHFLFLVACFGSHNGQNIPAK